jgi:hypothetical protein
MSYYTILIICEGEKTEPLFFNSINDELIDGKYNNDIRKVNLRIAPEPVIEKDVVSNVKHKHKRKKRTTNKVDSIDQKEEKIKILSGKPPLRWVLTAKEQLKIGAYDEVWVVFDNDDHPARLEAFKEAKKKVKGKEVNIAYSSRSFEYYLLVHFEKTFMKFSNTDCKLDSNTFIRCGNNKYPEYDCNGEKCINGYAQIKSYWNNTDDENTKNSESTYSIIKNKLKTGFVNSEWIRFKSNIAEGQLPIYDRNPYLSIDLLVKRLVDDENNYIWISRISEQDIGTINIKIDNNTISITNISSKTIIFPASSICAIRETTICLNNREIIEINDSLEIDISAYNSNYYWFKIEYEKYIIMFENEA